uniref:Uncharacterized protein n=1 Tax=viral metagenome TaxID=1070528 RepID=A0A6C0HB03_9ZZZZ
MSTSNKSIKLTKTKSKKNNTKKIKRTLDETIEKPILHGEMIEEKDGWHIAHIYGNPYERGFAHGYLFRNQFKKVLKVFPFIVKIDFKVSLRTFINKCNTLIKPKVKKHFPEFYEEIKGICAGLKYGNIDVSVDYIIAWNSIMSMSEIFDKNLQRCSAFIACGNSTEKGDIVMAHNTHSDYATGQLLNIVLYVTPEKGHPFVMQTMPGSIASTSDWFLCGSGIIGCETTIGDISYKPKFGTPFFCRIRQAMQYGDTLDDYVRIMTTNNAGDYACSWLLGNIKTNEIMLFELGLKIKNIQRTHNGVFYGMNSAMSQELRDKETKDKDFGNVKTSCGSRHMRLNELLNETYHGKINMENSKKIISDHYDCFLKKQILNKKGICNHSDLDGEKGKRSPYFPRGCTDGKVVNSEMAAKLSFVGRFGASCGEPFIVDKFIKNHPEYKDWAKVLEDRPRQKWSNITLEKI